MLKKDTFIEVCAPEFQVLSSLSFLSVCWRKDDRITDTQQEREKEKMRPLFMSSAKLPIIDRTPGVGNSSREREREAKRKTSILTTKTDRITRFVCERERERRKLTKNGTSIQCQERTGKVKKK